MAEVIARLKMLLRDLFDIPLSSVEARKKLLSK